MKTVFMFFAFVLGVQVANADTQKKFVEQAGVVACPYANHTDLNSNTAATNSNTSGRDSKSTH